MPTPIEWADEPQRMSNIRDGVGCPHGRLDICPICDQLDAEAAEYLTADEFIEELFPEGGEFVE